MTHCVKVATSTWVCAFAKASAFEDSMRMADARAPAFACSPFQRVAWYPLQAVATVATASSTVALNSSRDVRLSSAAELTTGSRRRPDCTATVTSAPTAPTAWSTIRRALSIATG